MSLLPFMPSPGFNSDDTSFSTPVRWVSGDGFRFSDGKPETLGGASMFSSSTNASRVSKLLPFEASGGAIKLAAAGDTLTYASLNGAATDITPAANWTTGAGVRRCLAMYGDILLALVSGGRLFESVSLAQAVAVTNAPTQSTVMLVTPTRQVMLLGTQEETSGTFNGRCIRWSDIEDRTDWTTSASNNAGEYILPGQEDIVSATVFGDYIVIWTEGSLWLAQYVGDPGQTFIFTRIDSGGICGLDAFAIYRNTVYWAANGISFYAWQLGGSVQSIPCPIRKALPFSPNAVFACANSTFGEIWFGLAASPTEAPDTYAVFCVNESARAPVWFSGSFGTAFGSVGAMAGAMVESALIEATGVPTGTQTVVHVYATSGTRKLWQWDSRGTCIAASYIHSSDFYINETQRRVMVRGVRPDFENLSANTPSISLTVYFRDHPQGAAVTKGPFALTPATTKKDFRGSGKIAQVRLSTADHPFRSGKHLFDVVPMGER